MRSKEPHDFGDRITSRHRSVEAHQKLGQHWRSRRAQWSQSFRNRKTSRPPGLFPEMTPGPNWAIGGGWPWLGRWPRTWWLLWQSFSITLSKWENLVEGQPSVQHFINQTFMEEWPEKAHDNLCGISQNACKWSSSPGKYYPYSEAWWWQHHAVVMFVSGRDRKTRALRSDLRLGR